MGEVLLQLNILDKNVKEYLKSQDMTVSMIKKGIDLT